MIYVKLFVVNDRAVNKARCVSYHDIAIRQWIISEPQSDNSLAHIYGRRREKKWHSENKQQT